MDSDQEGGARGRFDQRSHPRSVQGGPPPTGPWWPWPAPPATAGPRWPESWARHVAQSLATARNPGPVGLYAGAAVDALHAASMFAIAIVSAYHGKPALVDATVATAFCSLGLVAARSAPAGRLARG